MRYIIIAIASGVVATSPKPAIRPHVEYFPPNQFNIDDRINRNIVSSYSESLSSMGEPSLWGRSRVVNSDAAYRFLWLPSEGKVVSVRVERSGGNARLKLVILEPGEGNRRGRILLDKAFNLTHEMWMDLTRSVDLAGFWKIESKDPNLGLDGEILFFEGVDHRRYHAVERWCPKSGAFRRLCRYMVDIAGLEVDEAWHETSQVGAELGNFILLSRGRVSVAIRFLRHTDKGDGGAFYEWFAQEDGSNDFSKPNLKRGSGEVFENYSPKPPGRDPGQQVVEIQCGPIKVRWHGGEPEDDCIRIDKKSLSDTSIASTHFKEVKNINMNDMSIIWFGAKNR